MQKNLNLPNFISFFRLICLPFIIVLLLLYPIVDTQHNINFFNVLNYRWELTENYSIPISWMIAGILFIIAAFSDLLDGYIARKWNQVTNFGKFFDAAADKLLINSILIIMSCAEILPIWITLILILRDFLMDLIRQILAEKKTVLAASTWGKLKSFCQMLGITLLFFLNYKWFINSNLSEPYHWTQQIIMIPMYLSVFFSIFSATQYIYFNSKNLFK